VRDWGLGFHPNTGKGSLGHYGLQGMVERIHLLNGTCEVDTAPGAGTSITAIFPL
jgi:NarL family two-component system sensor histidine kinase YdfH